MTTLLLILILLYSRRRLFEIKENNFVNISLTLHSCTVWMGCQISRKNDSDHSSDLVIPTDTMTNQYQDAEINYKARLEKKLCLVRPISSKTNSLLPVDKSFFFLQLGKRNARA